MNSFFSIRTFMAMVIVLGGLVVAPAAHAWDYDSGWLNLSGSSSTSKCVYSHHMPWVSACSVTEGPQGRPQAQWFSSDLNLPGMSFAEGSCQVSTRSEYSGTNISNPADDIEDFQLTINGRTGIVRDPNSANGPEVHTMVVPGRFTFFDGWNRLYFAGETSRGWAGSVWFGDYHVYSWGADVLEAPGIRAVRVQCDNVSGPVCGNGTVETGEQCDDGNTANGDGCNNTCRTEVAGPVCGNGTVETGEQCDDSNVVNGDGCSATCQTEIVAPVCGNGVVESGEQCDDGNTVNNDGCSSACQTETAICGNGIPEGWGPDPEQCDDGNNDYTDACTQHCKVAVCGDGYVRSGVEQCDDGNTVSGDGCKGTAVKAEECTVETITGSCGSATTVPSCSAPTTGLCSSGAPGNVIYNEVARYWEWTCGGESGSESCYTRKRCGYTEINP